MKNTIVHKVLLNPITKTAVGVVIGDRNGNIMEIQAETEVILSAGSIATPQILMLSGIGPKYHLDNLGIETIVDLPVGKNLQDHVMLGLFLEVAEEYSSSITQNIMISYVIQYMLTRTGPLATLGILDFQAFIDTKGNNNYPDIQFHHIYINKDGRDLLKTWHEATGLEGEISDTIIKHNKNHDLLGIFPTLLHPKSKGEILLRDPNPLSEPIIKANYFEDKEDLKTMLRGIEYIQKLLNTSTYKSLNVKLKRLDIKSCVDFSMNSDAYWECYTRQLSSTVYHPVGTAKMGPKTDKTSVVNNDLLVHGVKHLRVVDASIIPIITGGNTMAPTLMIAEKAAEIMKIHYRKKDDL